MSANSISLDESMKMKAGHCKVGESYTIPVTFTVTSTAKGLEGTISNVGSHGKDEDEDDEKPKKTAKHSKAMEKAIGEEYA